ncbi:aldo/keto reductase [Halosimplex sp. TS25]|uniref:aldo/keto reductase n=1 Tax=Halosimplex rarum TaxID=3396619 RepID=UPI0039E93BA5
MRLSENDFPAIGLGTWQNTVPDECANSVQTALELGYRHIDTAHYYGNEESVGRGLQQSDIERDDVVVASKVHAEKFGLDYEGVIEGAKKSCERMNLERLDLLYVHWPVLQYDAEETLSAFEQLERDGVIDHVGLSNYSIDLLDEALSVLDETPLALQMEMHPFLHQDEILEYAQEHDIWLIAYSPLARGNVFESDVLQSIAEKHDVSEAQVSIAWLLSKDNVRVIPKASSEAHLRDNLNAVDLTLDEEDIKRIDNVDRQERYVERDDSPWLE